MNIVLEWSAFGSKPVEWSLILTSSMHVCFLHLSTLCQELLCTCGMEFFLFVQAMWQNYLPYPCTKDPFFHTVPQYIIHVVC